MAHIKLKVLLEQVQQEATLHPVKSELVEVEKIILKYLDDKERQKTSSLAKIGREFKEFYYAIRTKNYAAIALNIDTDLNELNYRLKSHRIKFTTFIENDTSGFMDKETGDITINANSAFDNISKVDGKWDVRDLMETIGHELIHRDQFSRGMRKSSYSQKDGGAKYWNDPAEVMTWAYTTINAAINRSRDDLDIEDVIEHIKTNPKMAEFLNRYTPKNRQKVVKHMIDYAKKIMEK